MRLSAGGHEKELCRGFRAKREKFFLDYQQNFFKTQNPGGGQYRGKKKKFEGLGMESEHLRSIFCVYNCTPGLPVFFEGG